MRKEVLKGKGANMIKAEAEYMPIIEKVYKAKQERVFKYWNKLSKKEKKELIDSLSDINFEELKSNFELIKKKEESNKKLEPAKITPIPKTKEQNKKRTKALKVGRKYLANGKVAAFLVAGGQGTRLGYDGPKGCFKISPVKKKTLFQIFAEKITAVQKKYNTAVPWYIMTSIANDKQTKNFFKQHKYFSLSPENIMFFTQKEIPAIDEKGKLMLETKSRVFKNPNGHGGSLLALHESGALKDMKKRKIKEIFYFQVDNPLVRMVDPVFIGYHVVANAQMSTKVVKKTNPDEKVGVVGYINRKLGVIEYSELSENEKNAKSSSGDLLFSAGNIAIHMLNRKFVEKLNKKGFKLPYHKAVKKIPTVDGETAGIKFEAFVFDALQYTTSSVTMEVVRHDEFAPVKNKEGSDSPETSIQMQNLMYARWLEYALINIPKDDSGNVQGNIEIHPEFALDPGELKKKLELRFKFPKGNSVYLDSDKNL
jgi:UDP-N-acetylglucosamine/UDP-N-acetylgalactosamine diphosphorylase